jgi:DNA adenine methylase
MNVSRPIVRYHGGKLMLAPWIIANFPAHRVYVEAFGGGGSVLLRKPPSYAEIYNDLDGEIVNVFRMARERGDELVRALELTPFAREEFEESYEECADPLERARRTILRSFAGFGSAAACGEVSGFRAASNRSGTTPAHDWRNYPTALVQIIERLRGVVIENRDAVEVMQQHDGDDTLHYVDPPYVHETRSAKTRGTVTRKAYKFELTNAQHAELAEYLKSLRGMVLVSGYRSELYDRLFAGWAKTERAAHADGARDRVECLWLNRAAESLARAPQMFAEVA